MRLKGELVTLFPSLGSNTSITHLNIAGNSIGDAGISAFAVMLNHNKVEPQHGSMCSSPVAVYGPWVAMRGGFF
jgi:hypothetical protein